MSTSMHRVHTDRLYVYANGTLLKVDGAGEFGVNTSIWTTAATRARVPTHSLLSDAVSVVLPTSEEAGNRMALPVGKYIAYGAKVLGTLDDVHEVTQHVLQGNGAEAVTASSKVGGGIAGAYAGGKVFGAASTPFVGPIYGSGVAAVGAGVGALAGAEAAESLAEKLSGGPTPDKLGPPLTLPNHLKLEPTLVTAEGDRYALVNVQGKYSWFSLQDNAALPGRHTEVVQGAKVSELTRSYLDAAGFPAQAERHNAQVAEQHRTALREQFRRSETHDAQALGPDGRPWGTRTRTAANATGEWARSPQPDEWLHTTRVQNPSGVETRVVKSVHPTLWEVTREQVHENGQLVAITDPQAGLGWTLNRTTGQMESRPLHPDHAAGSRMPPPLRDLYPLSDEQLQECHRQNAQTMLTCLKELKQMAKARGYTEPVEAESRTPSQPGPDVPLTMADRADMDPEARPVAQRFMRAGGELVGARKLMLERGMALLEAPQPAAPEPTQEPTTQPTSQAASVATSASYSPALTAEQQHHHQMAHAQLGPAMRERGFDPSQIDRVCAAATAHVQQHHLRYMGPVCAFWLSKDADQVWPETEREVGSMKLLQVKDALRHSPQAHLERAHELAQQQARDQDRGWERHEEVRRAGWQDVERGMAR